MQKIFLYIFTILFSVSSISQNIPVSKKTNGDYAKHKIAIQDDYTWLEDMRTEEVNNWVDKQNEYTDNHDLEINKTYSLQSKIKDYDTRTSFSLPDRKGKYFYARFRKDNKKAASLYFMKTLDNEPIEIVNPNKIYPENNTIINSYYPSKNSSFLAYKISIDGSDRNEIRFVDLYKNKDLNDVLKNIKFSNVAWNRDQGVFYKKNSNKEFFARDSTF